MGESFTEKRAQILSEKDFLLALHANDKYVNKKLLESCSNEKIEVIALILSEIAKKNIPIDKKIYRMLVSGHKKQISAVKKAFFNPPSDRKVVRKNVIFCVDIIPDLLLPLLYNSK